MSLKKICEKKILNEIFGCLKNQSRKILICDDYSLKLVNSVCKITDLFEKDVLAIQLLEKVRQPVKMEAVYIIQPTRKSIEMVIKDFKNEKSALYSRAHIFTTNECSKELIDMCLNSPLKKYLKNFRVAYIDYLVKESFVYSLGYNDYSSILSSINNGNFYTESAEKLFSLLVTLKAKPKLIYHKKSENCKRVCEELNNLLEGNIDLIDPEDEFKNSNTQLLVLERSFDGISILLHELTFQALAADILDVTESIYHTKVSGKDTTVALDETNTLWEEMKYKHIADVMKSIPKKMESLSAAKSIKSTSGKHNMTELKKMAETLPQYRDEMNKFNIFVQLIEKCFKNYQEKQLEALCLKEQDLATGTDVSGERIKDPLSNIASILQSKYTTDEKLRLILLYTMEMSEGIAPDNLERFLDIAKIKSEKDIFKKFGKMNFCVMENDPNTHIIRRKQKFREESYQISRFIPTLKYIMDEIASGSIDSNSFTAFGKSALEVDNTNMNGSKMNFNFGGKYNVNSTSNLNTSNKRLIIFVIGGVCHSEIRSAHEISKEHNCDVYIGGTSILTPTSFLTNIRNLS